MQRILQTFRERLLSGFSWNVVSAIAMQGSVLLSSVIVARLLGLQGFGVYAILVSTVMTAAAVVQGGVGIVATKFVGEHLATDPLRVGGVLNLCHRYSVRMGLVAGALLFLLAEPISADLLRKPELETLIRFASIATFFQVSVSYHAGALQGFGAFKQLSRSGIIAGLGHIALTALGARIGSVEGSIIGFTLASLLRTVVFGRTLAAVRKEHRIPEKASIAATDRDPIWRFALPASLASLVTMPSLWLVTAILARAPNGLELVAMLSIANQIRLSALQFPILLNAVSFSVLSRLKGKNEKAGFRQVFWSSVAISLAFSILLVTPLIAFAGEVLGIYGRNFSDARWLLITLLISVIPEMLAISLYQIIQSAGRMWYSLFAISIPRDAIYLILASYLIPAYSAVGVGFAYLAGWTFALLIIAFTLRSSATS